MAPKRRFCQHCQEYVSLRTYREHSDLYFNKAKDNWQEIESSDEEVSLQAAKVRSDLYDHDVNANPEDTDNRDEFHNEAGSAPGTYSLYYRRNGN